MGDKTGIAWTDATWNPTRGCAPVGEGCRHCYAERQAMRMSGAGGAYEGLVKLTSKGPTWTHQGRFVLELLDQPLRWKRPRKVFVDSMSDLFFEAFTFEQIAAVFGVMAAAHWHTFQVLTKRPQRALEFFEWIGNYPLDTAGDTLAPLAVALKYAKQFIGPLTTSSAIALSAHANRAVKWPLPNVWLCVSAWDQKSAAEMVPYLLETPAAVRGVSLEPLLGPIDLRHLDAEGAGHPRMQQIDALTGRHTDMGRPCESVRKLDWVIVGGESGAGAREFYVPHARKIVKDCKDTWRPCFFKQLGHNARDLLVAKPDRSDTTGPYAHKGEPYTGKGADPAEWEPALRVQRFPGEPWKST